MGCGARLQYGNANMEGYIEEENYQNASLCRRCFRIMNYGDYQILSKSDDEMIEIFQAIDQVDDLVVYVVDCFNMAKNVQEIHKYIDNKILLVLTKRDILPKSVRDRKLRRYMDQFQLNILETIVVSSEKNYNIDYLYDKIKYYKNSDKVYFVGNTNAGKSTLINKLIKNYSHATSTITTSFLPTTTLNSIEIELEEHVTLIDTPGLNDSGNIANYLDIDAIKRITPKDEIRPRTFQLEPKASVLIDEYVRMDYRGETENSFTLFMSNRLDIRRANYTTNHSLHDLECHHFVLNGHQDIVINGLGFIKVVKEGTVDIFVPKHVEVFVREELI